MQNSIQLYLKTIQRIRGQGAESFTLEHGKVFRQIPLPKGVKQGRLKECYKNAFHLALNHPEKYRYCEGWAAGPIIVEHAWVIDHNGNAIDPTWRNFGNEYFGVIFKHDYIATVALRSETYGILFNARDDFRLVRGEDKVEDAIEVER